MLFYLAGYWTSGVDLTLLQSAQPALVLAGAALFKGMRVTVMLQIVGMLVTFVGVGLIATQGQPWRIGELSLNPGDLMLLVACVLYSGYTLALRDRPAIPALVFFAGLAFFAFLTSLPCLAIEMALGKTCWQSVNGWLFMVFVALGPSLASQLFYMRGVELIGPGRAGIFTDLTPLFGALFAVLTLGEPFHLYHAAALALGLSGIFLAERGA